MDNTTEKSTKGEETVRLIDESKGFFKKTTSYFVKKKETLLMLIPLYYKNGELKFEKSVEEGKAWVEKSEKINTYFDYAIVASLLGSATFGIAGILFQIKFLSILGGFLIMATIVNVKLQMWVDKQLDYFLRH